MLRRRQQTGDTLIEVLFAVTVMSLAIVMSLSLMNQGTAASVRSLQITLVRQEIDSQADTLRFLNSAYVAAYTANFAPNTGDALTTPAEEYYKIVRDVTSRGATSVSKFGNEAAAVDCRPAPEGSFIVNTRTARYQPYNTSRLVLANSYPMTVYTSSDTVVTSEGVWIEAVRSAPSNGSSYIDFHVRACWGAVGVGSPMNIGTIVRLYEPAR